MEHGWKGKSSFQVRLTLRRPGNIHPEYKRAVNSAYYTFMLTSQVLADLIEVHWLDSRHFVSYNYIFNMPTTIVTLVTTEAAH